MDFSTEFRSALDDRNRRLNEEAEKAKLPVMLFPAEQQRFENAKRQFLEAVRGARLAECVPVMELHSSDFVNGSMREIDPSNCSVDLFVEGTAARAMARELVCVDCSAFYVASSRGAYRNVAMLRVALPSC